MSNHNLSTSAGEMQANLILADSHLDKTKVVLWSLLYARLPPLFLDKFIDVTTLKRKTQIDWDFEEFKVLIETCKVCLVLKFF